MKSNEGTDQQKDYLHCQDNLSNLDQFRHSEEYPAEYLRAKSIQKQTILKF